MKETETQRMKRKEMIRSFLRLKFLVVILSMPTLLMAQKGPGGVGTTDGSSSLELWLMADHDTAVHYDQNNNITGVSDLSGYNHHINKIYSYPKYQTNRINGKPAFEFDGKNDILVVEGFDVSPSKKPDLSIFVVFDSDEDDFDENRTARNDSIRAKLYGNDNHGWDRSAGFEERGHPSIDRGGGNWRYFRGSDFCDSTGLACGPIPMYNITQDSFYVFSSFHIESELRYYGYMNGKQVAYDSVNHNDGTPNFCVGALSDNSENTHNTYAKQQWWDGDIAEFIMFTRKLNTAERRAVENYLSAKYGIAMINTSNHDRYQGNNDYSHYVSGIGKETDGNNLTANSKGFIIESSTSSGDFLQDNGDYILIGKDDKTHGTTSSDLPSGFSGGKRWSEIWYVDVTDAGTAGGDVEVFLDFGEVGSFNKPQVDSNYRLIYRSGTTGNFSELEVQPTIINDSLKFTFSVGSGVDEIKDGYFTLASKNVLVSPLPVGLDKFEAHPQHKTVVLNWSTANELNNSHFEVERLTKNDDWISIGEVNGAGTTNLPQSYSYVDESPLSGLNYYRLKQVDLDRSFEYSNMLAVMMGKHPEDAVIYPNPFDDQLTMKFEEPVETRLEWKLLNLHGKVINEGNTMQVNSSLQINLSEDLKPGIYYIKANFNGQQLIKKIIKK